MRKLAGIVGIAILSTTFSFTNTAEKRIIVIDAGHGGHDAGAVYEEIHEKEITLAIANKIKEMNLHSNTEIVLTRDTDQFTTLEERISFINSLNPSCVISLHVNMSKNEASRGMELYVTSEEHLKDQSLQLALKIQEKLKRESSEIKIKNAGFVLLKKVNHPVAMIELGFLSNAEDRAYLTSEHGQTEIAKAILETIH